MTNLSLSVRYLAGLLVIFMLSCQDELDNIPVNDPITDLEQFSSELIPDQYIVVFDTEKTGVAGARFSDAAQAREYVKNEAMRIVKNAVPSFTEKQLVRVYSASINGALVRLGADKISALQQDESVAFIEQDQMITLAVPSKKEASAQGEKTPYGVKRVNGRQFYTGSNVAWVIDTGVDLGHPDLKVDASRSVTFISSGKDAKSADDRNGHGSHVAGTIAAKNNGIGVKGVAPGATIVAVKVLNSSGSGSYSGVIAGVDYVGENGKPGDVANMSLGGSVSLALDKAVVSASKKGIRFTLAAGNESDHARNHSPARANAPNIYTISAMDKNDQWAYFSNYGNPPVDYCAPGVNILSTYKNGAYAKMSGTSMAAPHAAGVLLLGAATSDGTVNGDPDGQPDRIISH